jgi:hypothetical protein
MATKGGKEDTESINTTATTGTKGKKGKDGKDEREATPDASESHVKIVTVKEAPSKYCSLKF